MEEVTKDTFEEKVVKSEKLTMVDFWGTQCAPCMALTPRIEALEKKYGERVKMVKVEASKNRRLCLGLKILSLPTILFYKGGQEVDRLTGNVTMESIEKAIERLL